MPDSQRPHGLEPTRLLCPWDFPGKSTDQTFTNFIPLSFEVTSLTVFAFYILATRHSFSWFSSNHFSILLQNSVSTTWLVFRSGYFLLFFTEMIDLCHQNKLEFFFYYFPVRIEFRKEIIQMLLFQGQSLNEILSGPYERNIFSFPSLIFQLLFILHVLLYPSNKCLFFQIQLFIFGL